MGDAYRCRREVLLQIFDRTAVQCLPETKLLEGAVNALLMATSKSMCGWGSLEFPAIHCLACSGWAQPHLQSFGCPPILGTCEVAAGLCQGADRFAMI